MILWRDEKKSKRNFRMKFDLTINSLEVADLGELISQLRPHWNQTEIKVKTFTEG